MICLARKGNMGFLRCPKLAESNHYLKYLVIIQNHLTLPNAGLRKFGGSFFVNPLSVTISYETELSIGLNGAKGSTAYIRTLLLPLLLVWNIVIIITIKCWSASLIYQPIHIPTTFIHGKFKLIQRPWKNHTFIPIALNLLL